MSDDVARHLYLESLSEQQRNDQRILDRIHGREITPYENMAMIRMINYTLRKIKIDEVNGLWQCSECHNKQRLSDDYCLKCGAIRPSRLP